MSSCERTHVAFFGAVDHGKSSLVSTISCSLNNPLLQNRRKFHTTNPELQTYTLVDSLDSEICNKRTEQSTRLHVHIQNKEYILIDVPGHIELVSQMLPGASLAKIMVYIVDCKDFDIRLFTYNMQLLKILGMRSIIVCINKMDSISYKKSIFDKIKENILNSAHHNKISIHECIPTSSFYSDNLFSLSDKTKWYTNRTLIEAITNYPVAAETEKHFVTCIQHAELLSPRSENIWRVYGKVESGMLEKNSKIILYPDKKEITLINFKTPQNSPIAKKGDALELHVSSNNSLKRGNIITSIDNLLIHTSESIRALILWLSAEIPHTHNPLSIRIKTQYSRIRIRVVEEIFFDSSIEESYHIYICDIFFDEALCTYQDETQFTINSEHQAIAVGISI